jgi:hypothetical protein
MITAIATIIGFALGVILGKLFAFVLVFYIKEQFENLVLRLENELYNWRFQRMRREVQSWKGLDGDKE